MDNKLDWSGLDKWAAAVMEARIPFTPLGRSREGCDCWGLFRLAYMEVAGVLLPSFLEDYDAQQIKDFDHLQKIVLKDLGKWDKIEREKTGDGILLNMRNRPIHVGIVLKPGLMLHIEEGIEACVENYRAAEWKRRVAGFYRFNPAG